MSRKDYIKLAQAFNDALAEADRLDDERMGYGIMVAASLVANVLADDNPRFDKIRFLTAVKRNESLAL